MQWLMIGQPMENGDGVVVLASNKIVGSVKIHEEFSYSGGEKITITVQLDEYTKVRDTSYADALARIFNGWRDHIFPQELERDQG